MKGKILVVGLIALLLAGGLFLAGCDSGCTDYAKGECVYGQTGSYSYGKGTTCGKSKCAVTKVNSGTTRVTCDC